MAGYKSLQVADALQRVTQQLTPQVTYGTLENSVYGRNTNTPDPTIQDVQAIQQANQAYQGLYNKTGGDYAQDAAVALGKGIVAVPQAAAGIVDILDAGAQYATGQDVQGGRFSKTLADAGVDFARTQDIMQGWYSEGTQKQFQGLSQLPGMSMNNSVSDNLSSLRDTLGYVAENPSLAANTIVESLPLIAAGGVVGRGAASLGAKAAQGAIGEGTVMTGSAQANMTRNEQGYTTGQQALGALGIGVLGGIVGQLGAKVAGHSGAADIDTLSTGLSQQVANKGFKSLAVGTATEAAEEAAQTSLENVISNVTSGRDAIQGLNQDLVLGTLAGAGMGAASNARSSIASSALQALQTAATRQAERMQDRIKTNAPEQSDVPTEDLVNTASADYNPGAAIVREVGSITADSTPEEISTAKTKADTVLNDAEESLANLQEMKQLLVEEPKVINGINSVQAILDTIGDTDPDRSAKGNAMMTALQQKMDNIKTIKDSFTTEQLDTAIAERTTKVQAARDMHNKYKSLLNTVTGDSTPDVKIFGAPSAYTPAQIAKAIADPNVPETSKVALRALSDAVVAQNKVKGIDTVNGQIVGKRYDPNYRSTPQYIEQFAKALNSGSSAAQTNLLREIGAFEQSHTQKAALVSTGLEQAQATGQKMQVVRNQDGNWELNQGPLLSRDEATANGAITINPTASGIDAVTEINEYMQAEAQAITATRIAMEHMSNVRNNINGTVTQPSNVATPSTPQTQETQAQPSSNIQDALDSYNQDLRDNYDFQPEQRVTDPRTDAVSPQATIDTPTSEVLATETQPTDVKPVAKAERVASRSVSEDVATEVQASTEEAIKATDTTEDQVDVPEVKTEVEPQDINTAEKPEKNAARTTERSKAPNKRNLIVDGFNQRETVLNKNANFLSRFMNREDNARVVESITNTQLNDKQKQAVKDFTKFANYFSTKLDGLIFERKGVTAKGNDYTDFRYQDYNQFLLEDGSLPENIKTAVSAAMYTWLAENGSKTLNTEKDITGMLLVNDVDNLPTHVFSALTGIGDHQSVVTASLGQKALEALGLSVVSDVDPARKQKLEQALGTLAAVALTQNGYLEHNTMKATDFQALQQAAVDTNDKATLGNQSVVTDKVLNFLVPKDNTKVKQVIESAAETQGIVHSMFGVQRDIKLPSLEPVTTTPKVRSQFDTATPSYAADMYAKSQQNGYKMSIPAMQFMDNVKHEDLREMFGYVAPRADGVSFEGMHKKFWESQLAANQSVERAIQIIKEQRANLGDDSKEFFFEHTIWVNNRSGYDAAFNLQANKMHRAVAGMSAHVTDVGIEPTHRNGETTKFGEFLMAVAMTAEEIPIGIKTVDKVSSETYLAKFQEYLNTPKVQEGIVSMAYILETGKAGTGDMANVKALVSEFGMGAMSLRGVQALAQMYIAERDGADTFTTDIAFESDGVTNGPVITNVALATAVNDMLEAGGIFTDPNKTNVPTNKELGAQDIYEQLGEVMKRKWLEYKTAVKGGALNSALALDVIYNAFGERNGAKPIVTTSNYGAGIASIKRANAREVLNSFYKKMEKAGNNKDTAEGVKQAQALVAAVNATIQYSNFKQKLNTPYAIAKGDILEFLLSYEQEAALTYAADLQHGETIKSTLEDAMDNFQVVRDIMTEQAVAGFAAYEIVHKAAIETALADTSNVLVDGEGTRQEGLTSDELKKVLKGIIKYMPSVISGMGNLSTNGKQSSIPLMKQDSVWDATAMSEQQFNFHGSWQAKGTGKFSVRSAIKRDAIQDPGVSGLALIIQSIDAMIAHTTIGNMPTQNYHDANASAVGKGKAMAKIQNEAFVDGLMNTHVNREFVRATLQAFQAFVDMPALLKANPAEAKAAYDKLSQSLTERVQFAYQQDNAKLKNMLTWVNINQYGTQGGHYVMTAAKRKEILNMQSQLQKDLAKDLKQAKAIDALFNVAVAPVTIEDHLRTKGTMTGAELVPMLQGELKQFEGKEGKFPQFYNAVLDLVTKQMPSNLEINYFNEVDAPTNVSGLDEAIKQNNPAWFTTGKDGNPQINILRGTKPVTARVLVHELVHAITVDSISRVRNDPTAHAKAKESLDKLDALYEHIKAQVKADPNATDLMKYATQNVEEFIATGFSYPEFVDYLDATLAPKAVRGKNRIVTALRSFVDSILGVLESFTGRKYSSKDATALEALILDSTEFLGRAPIQTTGTQTNIFGAPQEARDAVSGYSSKQVFDALNSNISPEFKTHLSTLMTQVSDTIYSALDQRLITNPDGTWSAEQAWEQYIDAGNAVTTETAVTAGFRMTEQESFAVESLYAAFVHGLKDNAMTQVYAEMDKAFKAAKAKLKPENFYEGDWATASVQDKADAQDMYDFLFKLGNSNKEHLARFTAMALGSQQFNSMLGFSIRDTDAAPEGVFQKIVEYTNTLLNYVMGLLTNSSSSQLVNGKLNLLAKELARIDGKNRNFAVSKLEAQFDKLQDYADTASGAVRERVAKLAEHDAIANSRFTAVRLASNVTRLSAKGDLWTTLDAIKDANTLNTPNERLGMWGEIINEAANNNPTKALFERMFRTTKLNDQMKENIRDTTTKNVMSTFEENGSYLSKEDKHSLTVMLRADVQALDDTYSTAEIAKLYSDAKYLTTERTQLETQLHGLDASSQVMINRAKQLAKYMITGLSSDGLAKNAQLIVSGFNSGEVVDRADTRVDLVDRIATMYAIEYTSAAHKARLNTIMKRELKNKVNGIDTSIKFHKELAKTARDTLFTDNITSVMKGYVPEVTNPNKDVRIANNELEAQVLKQQFYTEVKTLVKDGRDRTTTKPRLFMTEESGLQRIVSGAVEIVSTNRKGTEVFLEQADLANTITGITHSIPNSASYNPMKDPQVYMTPNYNTNNEVIGFSYEMSGNNRDTLLERNNDFAELLGAYAATNYNKVTVPNQNNKVIDAAYQDYKDNFTNDPRAYVNVGPTSTDPGLREVWAMLPEATREHVLNVWGDDGMFVRNDVLLIMFGYRKYSLNQAFDKMEDARNMFEALYVGVMSMLFGNKAKVRGTQGERVWQEAVHTMKDIIVIRNVKTLIGNTMSNAMLLMAHGVSSSDILKDSLLAIRAGTSYRKDMGQLMAIRQKQRAGVGDFNALEQEALKLEDAIERNPLRDFINEGMMPTIVEDVDPSTEHYSYKSKMRQRVDEYTSAVPKSVKSAAKWLMVSPETPLYQFLNNATQFADFSSKYVLYKHATTKAKEKLSHNDALQLASDNFINYDVPTAKGLQYLNDMGVVMFTKYNLRIQKALFQLMKKRPASVMAQALLLHSFTNLETAIDPMVWFQMGNPLRTGAFGLPGALDEPLPIKMLTSVL